MTRRTNAMSMVHDLLQSSYDKCIIGEFVKYGNHDFDVIFKKNNVVLVTDKRNIHEMVVYKDIKTAHAQITRL
jgi:hypothetical protein